MSYYESYVSLRTTFLTMKLILFHFETNFILGLRVPLVIDESVNVWKLRVHNQPHVSDLKIPSHVVILPEQRQL